MSTITSRLKVEVVDKIDIYSDFVRVQKFDRKNQKGEIIKESTLCKIRVSGTSRQIYAFLRGNNNAGGGNILIDEYLREKLGVCTQETYEFIFDEASLFGIFRWSWNSTNPAYRISLRIALIALIISLIQLVPTILNITRSYN